MKIEILKANGIDYEEGLDRFSGNVKLYEKYLRKLLDNTLYEDMKKAILEKDLKAAFEHAHNLKAFIGNLSIPQFYEEIKELTENLRNNEEQDYQKKLAKLDEEYQIILMAIRSSDDV